MRLNRFIARALFLLGVMAGGICAFIIYSCLPGYAERVPLAIAALVGGLLAGAALRLIVSRLPPRGARRLTVLAIVLALVVLPPVSMFCPGEVTYSRFGVTVYGLIPIPVLDITVDATGVLWFREKNHLITRDEVGALLTEDVRVVVIGTGWQEAANVEDAMKDLGGVEVLILSTPEAFKAFNRLRRSGRNVVLLAHTTC